MARRVFAFPGGWMDARDMSFHDGPAPAERCNVFHAPPPEACELLGMPRDGPWELEWGDWYARVPTPAVDAILGRLPEAEARRALARLGALLLDASPPAVFVVGPVGAGKSTLLDLVASIFPPDAVRRLSEDQRFGLEGAADKMLVVAPDVSESAAAALAEIVADGEVTVRVPMAAPRAVTWRAPLLMAGRSVPGAFARPDVARRLFAIELPGPVARPDPDLLVRMLKEDLPATVAKMAYAYHCANDARRP